MPTDGVPFNLSLLTQVGAQEPECNSERKSTADRKRHNRPCRLIPHPDEPGCEHQPKERLNNLDEAEPGEALGAWQTTVRNCSDEEHEYGRTRCPHRPRGWKMEQGCHERTQQSQNRRADESPAPAPAQGPP